jgi:hypothetical protein
VISLTENHEYEFRVAAINAAGTGPWSTPSESIKCQPAVCAPKITSDLSMRDITVVAGDEFCITVPFIAMPKPRVNWTVHDQEVYASDRLRLETTAHETVLHNLKANRKEDNGKYTVFLNNTEGSDSAHCKVTVVDKPSPPTGPLDCSDITPDSCSLSWRPPLDDGGAPISNYVVEREDPGSGWGPISRYCRNCKHDVLSLQSNTKYRFRIRAENQYGISLPLEMDSPITAKFPFNVPEAPQKPQAADTDMGSATVSWLRPLSDGGAKIQGYSLEYRDVRDKDWRKANEYLIKETSFKLHGLTVGDEYEFRIKAKNVAGFSKPSPASSRVKLKGAFGVPSAPGTPQILKIGKGYCDLQWDIPKSDGGSRITGYVIERREIGYAFWIKASDYNVTDTIFTAINLTEGLDYEFRVYAVNAAGRSDPSPTTAPVKISEVEGGEKPEFVRRLMNISAGLNRLATLECEATGKPEPRSRWLKNGREVSTGSRITCKEERGVFKLVISEVWENDDGDYVCEASNSFGSVTTTARLKIGIPPRIDRMPGDTYLPEGDNTKIKCYFSGDQPMNVRITKNNVELQEDSHFKFTEFDEYIIIFIKDIVKSDAGTYNLHLKNDSGEASASFTLYITGLPGAPIGPLDVSDITTHMCNLHWRPPAYDGGMRITHYVVERKDITHTHWVIVSTQCKETTCIVHGLTENQEYLFRVMAVNENGMGPPLEGINPIKAKMPYDPPSAPGIPEITEVGGDFVNLSWEKPASDGGSRVQGYWIEKHEVGQQLWQRVNHALCSPTQINISHLIEDRQYEFRVFAVNEAGQGPESSNSQPVKVQDPHAASPPEIVKPLKDVMALQGKSGQFQCTILANPAPRITWYKGMRELCNSAKYTMNKEGDNYYLSVSDIYGEDEDEYQCRAVNSAGAKSTRAELIIKTAPKINVPPRFRDTAFFEKGENVVIKIPFTGNPKPRMKWMMEGQHIESGSHYRVEIKDRHSILTIMDVSNVDSGPYLLSAENDLGMDSCIIKVQVSDVPDPPRYPKIEKIQENSLILSWNAPLWDGGSSVTNYVIEKRELPMSSWIRCGNTRFTTHEVTGLGSNKEYEFRIFAENIFGRSGHSEISSVVRTQEVIQKKKTKKREGQ